MNETDIILQASPIDSDGVIVVNNTPENINVPSASTFRYGRLWMNNVYGSELQALTVPLQAQYWTGVDYQINNDDSCTAINPVNITMDAYQKNLNACETALSGGGTMSHGKLDLSLSAPGNENNGSLTLTPNLSSATGSACITTSSSSPVTNAGLSWFGSPPAAKATFGLRKSAIIYFRENF